MELQALLDKFKEYNPNSSGNLIAKAYHFAEKAHEHQKRESGEPYFTHCYHVADILLDFKMDEDTICAGLLHDTVEDTDVKLEDLKREFNKEVAHMVQGVTKISDLKFSSTDEETVENWRKMLIAVAEDVRVILIKLADRTHNMRTMDVMPPDKQKFKAYETLTLYAPLAQRLGMFTIKTDLEDLSFKYLHPLEYNNLKQQVEARTADRQAALDAFKQQLEPALKEEWTTASFPAQKIIIPFTAKCKNTSVPFRKSKIPWGCALSPKPCRTVTKRWGSYIPALNPLPVLLPIISPPPKPICTKAYTPRCWAPRETSWNCKSAPRTCTARANMVSPRIGAIKWGM